MRKLTPRHLRNRCDVSVLRFADTSELTDPPGPIGQHRAVDAVDFAANIKSDGYNVYVMGQVGTGRSAVSRELLEKRTIREPVPDDWCYVYNFASPRLPKAISLPAGEASKWQADMEKVIVELGSQILSAFESEEYIDKRDDIVRSFREERNRELQEFEREVEAAGLTLGRSPAGLIIAPASDGEVMDPQQYRELPEEQREELERKRQELQNKLAEIMRRGQREERQTRQLVQELDREVARNVIEPLLEDIRKRHRDHPLVVEHLEAIQEDLLDNIGVARQAAEDGDEHTRAMGPSGPTGGVMPLMDRYRVNVLISKGEARGAPVVFESNPTIEALTGEVEYQTQMGALVTDFTMIKAGALHKANGGYLVLEAHQLLMRPFAWEALKRALKNRQVRIESLRDQYRFVSTVSLEPEPVPLNVRVVLIGSPLLYYLLYEYDEDFRKLFKVKADFDNQIARTAATSRQFAALIGQICRKEELPHFSAEAVARVIEHASRLTGDRGKLSLNISAVSNTVREAAYWASRRKRKLVSADDVQHALDQHTWRSSRIEERIVEMIKDGTIMVDVDGEIVGQINGIAVLQLGDYSLGKPSRITCLTYLGRSGVVNIDREVKLTGRIHDKGLLTIAGFLSNRYGQERPLSVSATISFEQAYEGIDGDSASSTELYALLSSLADVPIKQGIAVTGSVNQKGEIQAIGGVNDKIEGYFAVCKAIGLTGEQGVMIPETNMRHLMLNDEVVEAVESGQFHVWAVKTIDEGIELLTGVKAGKRGKTGRYPKNSINALAETRLEQMADKMRDFAKPERNENKGQSSAG
ncbi:MAG: AAA family ATPase [candidate division WS1 bacterium]|nr:AAA family ATPase [candidate division WS1 bacterium]